MRREALRFVEEEKEFIIFVEFLSHYKSHPEWKISEIAYKEPGQRTYSYFTATFKDTPEYKKLNMKARKQYALNKFIEFVGREKIEEALLNVWQQLKPDVRELTVGCI